MYVAEIFPYFTLNFQLKLSLHTFWPMKQTSNTHFDSISYNISILTSSKLNVSSAYPILISSIQFEITTQMKNFYIPHAQSDILNSLPLTCITPQQNSIPSVQFLCNYCIPLCIGSGVWYCNESFVLRITQLVESNLKF